MRHPLLVGIAILTASCSSPEDSHVSQLSVDVEVITWTPDDVPQWSVTPEPILELGPEAGFARVTAAGLQSDGSFVALDVTLQEVRRYDAESGGISIVGAKGEGPGEYEFPGGVWTGPHDSIFVWDLNLRRASVYAPTGGFARSFNVPPTDSAAPVAAGPFPDGDWLIGFHSVRGEPSSGARSNSTIGWKVTDATGMSADAFSSTASTDLAGVEWQGRTTTVPVIFGGTSRAAPLPDGIIVMRTDDPEWSLFDRSGKLWRLVRGRLPGVPLESADKDRSADYRIARAPADADLVAWRDFFDATPFADTFPRFDELKVSRGGEIWIQQFRPWWEHAASWWVFSPSGHVLGQSELPPGFTLLAVMGDRLLGVSLDEFDVPVLQVIRLSRESV